MASPSDASALAPSSKSTPPSPTSQASPSGKTLSGSHTFQASQSSPTLGASVKTLAPISPNAASAKTQLSPTMSAAGKTMGKSASTGSLSALRHQMLQHEPFWRNQREMTDEELETLESTWDKRHWMHFSRNNPILSPTCRDYFDRPRHERGEYAGVTKIVKQIPSWSLEPEPRDIGAIFGRSRPVGLGRSCSGLPQFAQTEAGWNDRHHVAHSEANHLFHDNDREYFGSFQGKRSKRVIPKRVNGITNLLYPYRQKGNPDGMDQPPTNGELLLRPGHDLPVHPVPRGILERLTQTM